MKKLLKRLIPMALAVMMMCSVLTMSQAAQSKSVKTSTGYNKYVTCTLINKRKAGYVRISTVNSPMWKWFRFVGPKNSVRMTTTNGRLIWEEKDAIGYCGSRNFYLGRDNSAYRIYVKTAGNAGTAQYIANGNVRLK